MPQNPLFQNETDFLLKIQKFTVTRLCIYNNIKMLRYPLKKWHYICFLS